jgi:exodeoxyribonuclease-3
LIGDYNVAPTDLDIYPTKSWSKDALVQPAPLAAFASLVTKGWTDALRDVFGDERVYTFWTYCRDRYVPRFFLTRLRPSGARLKKQAARQRGSN